MVGIQVSNPNSIDLGLCRKTLLDPEKSYLVVKGLYSKQEIQEFRQHCEKLASLLPRLDKRINAWNSKDYIHFRSHDRMHRTKRIYQFHHNHINDYEGRFFNRAISLREEIETGWDHSAPYRQRRSELINFSIATHYQSGFGCLGRHRDSFSEHTYPLLQSLLLLSSHPEDYLGGDFILYTADGKAVSVQADLQLEMGDVLYFDKSLEHEVCVTYAPTPSEDIGKQTPSNVGRWSLLIGARSMPHSYLQRVWRSFVGSPLIRPFRRSTF